MRFVIVEDEIRIREGIKKLLMKLDASYDVAGEAENGVEGLELVKAEKPDIVITDVKMPLLDGLGMLQQLYDEGISFKAIVLSAYSEFEYARTAMKLGVTEYLLKPVALPDFTNAVENVIAQIEKTRREGSEQATTRSQMFRGILNGAIPPDTEVKAYLQRSYQITEEMPITLAVFAFTVWEREEIDRMTQYVQSTLLENETCAHCILEDETKKVLQVILYQYEGGNAPVRWLQHFARERRVGEKLVISWTEAAGITSLKMRYEQLLSKLDWHIVLDDESVLAVSELEYIQTAVCVYPIDIENRMKTAIGVNDAQRLLECVERFHANFHQDKVYEPRKIKECYVRFFWSLINFSKEAGGWHSYEMEQQELLEQIMRARTVRDLRRVTDILLEQVHSKEETAIGNRMIRRAVAMIREFYRTGLTLDEIASKLDVTPEYLGTQFHREMGVTFRTYMKNYRLSKAKKLLLGTSLKVYEIAEQIGYSDPKYFSKVFRDATGQLPGEYRQTHR